MIVGANSMTIFIFSTMVSIASCKVIKVGPAVDQMWNEYKNTHKKNYTDDVDLIKRRQWEKHLSNIMEHNLGYYNGSNKFSQALNHFSDMSEDDFRNKALGLEEKLPCKDKSLIFSPPSNATVPDSIDWRERGYVTKVQSQGSCGACWAFSSIGALEGQHKRMTGNLVKLSEQQLIDCSTTTGNKQCEGGQMCRAYEYVALPSVGGVEKEQSYPLTDSDGKCKFSTDHIGSQIKGYVYIPKHDEQALLMAVALIGPVAAGLNGYQPSFRHYKNGIYDDPSCNKTLNHAVTIVGYGEENGVDYWLVKNSWGPRWGDNGFGKIARNANNLCGIASKALFPVLEADSNGKPILTSSREK